MRWILFLVFMFSFFLVSCSSPASFDSSLVGEVMESEESFVEEKKGSELDIFEEEAASELVDVQENEAVVEDQFRLEIPTATERTRLPSCDGLSFTTFPVDMDEVSGITPLGNLGPPGHTFPTDHPHLHLGEYGDELAYSVFSPADVYLTLVSWGDGMTDDPRDYTIYFALCQDVIAYYNHVKTVSDEVQEILDEVECEDFSTGGDGCTKVIDLEFVEEGNLIGTVGHKQGNFDFGLIDLRVDLDFVSPEKYAERSRHIQCAFDYYPDEMKSVFYDLLIRDDGSCSTTMQDLPGTLKGNWFHSSVSGFDVDWDMHLAFVEEYEFSEVQVVSVAGIFTDPGKFEFSPRSSGNINRDFAQVGADGVYGEIYCYQSEELRSFQPGASGKIVVRMLDEETLEIEHQEGSCNGDEQLLKPEIYVR